MKRSANYLVWAALLAFVAGCFPLIPNPRFAGEPRITSISFPGIPAEDVSIDQKSKTIRVKLPPILPPMGSPQIEVAGNVFAGYTNWANVFAEPDPEYRKIELLGIGTSTDSQPAQVVESYRLEFLPAGPLEIDAEGWASNPPKESGVVNLAILFKNLYANDLPVEVRLTNIDTQETSVIDSLSPRLVGDNPYLRFLSRSWGSSLAQMNLLTIHVYTFGSRVVPGTYRVALITKEGRTIDLPQPVTFIAGQMAFNDGEKNGVPKLIAGEEFIMTGRNLFQDGITIKMLDSTDHELPLNDVRFDPYGNRISFTIPAARDGRYVIQAINRFGGRICQLIEVTGKPVAELEISKIVGGSDYCSLKEPLALVKNQEVMLFLYKPADNLRLKITSTGSSSQQYYSTVKPLPTTTGKHIYNFFVPGIAPGGPYRVTLQSLDASGRVTQEGPPYWRLIQIK